MRIASCIYALTGIGLTFLPGLLRGSSSHKTCLSAASNKSLAEARAVEAPEENTPSERRRSQLVGMCQRRKLRLSATNALPVALWSMRGSGSAWLRIVLELATGYSTGSTALDHEVSSAALRNGAWFNRTDCDMIALATTGAINGPPWASLACDGTISRAIFLVRHPFSVAWSTYMRPGCSPGQLSLDSGVPACTDFDSSGWHEHAVHSTRLWTYLVDYPNVRLDSGYRVWMRSGRAHLWSRMEDLLDGAPLPCARPPTSFRHQLTEPGPALRGQRHAASMSCFACSTSS